MCIICLYVYYIFECPDSCQIYICVYVLRLVLEDDGVN